MAILDAVNLTGADLRSALLSNTFFARVDLCTVKGLTKIRYNGPSHIELDTIQFSQDSSALYFLRSVRVPEKWINDYRAVLTLQHHRDV